MRPLRLTMTAFGPYAGTEVVDFDALTDLGLFVVAGNNGSGKTTIFDALHYSLYGTLPGRRSSYPNLRSDHAPATVDCKVTLDFRAHGSDWRVERLPTQTRAKRRGAGTTQAPASATLFRLDDGTPHAVTNRIEEVRAQCAELVGLSGKQFERVALLPQGEFSRVLQEGRDERRKLLRTLFSSEIFGDVTSLLTEQAAAATAADRAVLDGLDHHQVALAEELAGVIGRPLGTAVADLMTEITEYRQGPIEQQRRELAKLDKAASQAKHQHQAAVDVVHRLERRAAVRHQHQQHEQGRDQHELDVERLRRGRAAVPVANHARSLAQHQHQQASATERIDHLLARTNQVVQAAGVHPLAVVNDEQIAATTHALAELTEQLGARAHAAQRVDDLDLLTKRLQGDLRRLGNEVSSLHEQREVAQAQLRQTRVELDRLASTSTVEQCEHELRSAQAHLEQRTEFAQIDAAHQKLVRLATDLDASIERLRAETEAARDAHAQHERLQYKADAALAAFQQVTDRRRAVEHFGVATARLTPARHELAAARNRADQLWDAFIAGTAARVAEALVDDEACPVCGSAEHPAPATHDDTIAIASQDDVSDARRRTDELQHAVSLIETEIETLRATDADIASRSITELTAEISTAKAMALGAQAAADEAHKQAARLEPLTAELTAAHEQRAETDIELRSLDQRRSHIEGSLGPVVHQTIDELQQRVTAAEHARAEADELLVRQADLHARHEAAEQDLETIELGQLAAETRRASAADQLVERQAEYGHAHQVLVGLEDALADASTGDTPSVRRTNFEQRAQASRQASELLGQLSTGLAQQSDATDAVRRAQSILNDRLAQSVFASIEEAQAAFIDADVIAQLEAQTTAYLSTGERLQGQLQELANLPDAAPDIASLEQATRDHDDAFTTANRSLIAVTTTIDRIESELHSIEARRAACQSNDVETRRLERVAALVKGDNDRNTSLENWVLAAHLRDVVELANIRLARSTHQRFQLCVLDDGENRRGKWGLDLGVEDTVTGTRRPTAGLSGGELFQASLALALGLADAVMNQSSGVRIDALFIDEGFGSLDETSVERAIDLLDELRDRGAMVGVITHVPALLDALPLGVRVIDAPDGQGSTIRQASLAA